MNSHKDVQLDMFTASLIYAYDDLYDFIKNNSLSLNQRAEILKIIKHNLQKATMINDLIVSDNIGDLLSGKNS